MDDTIISLTSIPTRFVYLPTIIEQLTKQQVKQIWLNIPFKYNRFPDEEIILPNISSNNVIINRCKDYGPGTMYFGPIEGGYNGENIVVVNDDTLYPSHMSSYFVELINKDKSVWCTSGFKIDEYINNNGIVQRYDKTKVDVTESYGGVILKTQWLKNIKTEFEELLKYTYNDDILVSNLMSKYNIHKKSVCDNILNIGMIKQFSYGMGPDALFQNNGEGSHVPNNKRVFKTLNDNKVFYF